MKKSLLALCAVPSLLLASCSFTSNFYGKTFEYRKDIYCTTLESIDSEINKSFKEVFTSNWNLIDWSKSGGVNSGFLVTEYVPFEHHENYDEMYSSMKNMSLNTFNNSLDGLKMKFSSQQESTCELTFLNQTKTYNVDYAKATDGEVIGNSVYFKNSENKTIGEARSLGIGDFSSNSCIAFSFDDDAGNTTNYKAKFAISFTQEVLGYKQYSWDVYPLIN